MPRFTRLPAAIAACLILLSLITGCSLFDSSTSTSSALSSAETTGNASMNIKFVLPPQADGLAASTLIRGAMTGRVKIILQVRQPGSAANKAFAVVKTVDVVSEKAETTISALPEGLAVVRVELENASVSGWKSFHGAGDLKASTVNEVEVSPPGSKLQADLLATTLQEAITNDTLMAAAGSSIATNLLTAVKLLDANSENIYSQVMVTLIDQVAPTGMIKVVYDNTTRKLTGYNGPTQVWQVTYESILGTEAIATILPADFTIKRILRQGFDYSLVEWRNTEHMLSLVTSHNLQTGAKQSMLMNQGLIDQAWPFSSTDYLISGYNQLKKAPMVCRWNTSKTAYTEINGITNKNLEWDHYFTDELYTSDPPKGPIVANLFVDASANISAFVKNPNGVIHPYTLNKDSGAATANFTGALNLPPTVSLTAPTSGATSADNQTLTITANPADSDIGDSIKEVEFLANGSVVGKATASPWSYNWSGMTAGEYKLVARAYDTRGFAGVSSPVCVTITSSGQVNAKPTVRLDSPSANAVYTYGSSVSIVATAGDTDGSVSKVEFYQGSTLIGSDNLEPYTMTWAKPAAGSYSLKAKAYDNNNASTESAAVAITVNTVNSGTGPDLMITEIGSRKLSEFGNVPCWIELLNKSSGNIQLSNFSITSRSIPPLGGYITESKKFPLPAFELAPGSFAIVRFNNDSNYFAGPQVVHGANVDGEMPYWEEWGYLDLRNSSNETVDYVRFGDSSIATNQYGAPSSSSQWSGTAAPAMPSNIGYSLARNLEVNDDNTSGNWALRGFHTPAAYNDVISDVDADGDGIPDANEAPGKTFCGLPYYDWGARAGTKDIFVHIDYMNPADCPDPLAVTPRTEALRKIQEAFKRKDINIHFDVGTLFGTTVEQFCMDGRDHKVSYSKYLNLSPLQGSADLYSIKASSFPIAKLPVFHYCLLGYLCPPSDSFSGLGEMNGNDFVVTLGSEDSIFSETGDEIFYLINSHASTIMHELGHNLGLEHGGNENANFKPNYISIMNYMYSNNGLPTIGNNEGDRYYYYRYVYAGESKFSTYLQNGTRSLQNHAYSDSMVIDYSDGTSKELNEASISEPKGLLRDTSGGVDFNGDGDKTDSNLSMNLNPTDSSNVGKLLDFNDWGAISARFSDLFSGQASIRASTKDPLPAKADYLAQDIQKFIVCDPMCRHGKK